MSVVVDTRVEQARSCVQTEREAVNAKLSAIEAFVDRVTDVSAEPAPASTTGATTVTGTQHGASSGSDSGCRQVRSAFADTIRPHSVDDVESEALLETIRAEFNEQVAVALAPTTDTSFTPALRQLVLAEANARRSETEALARALARESRQLAEAGDVVDDVTGWLTDADETPLTALGFDALERRHETLADHRERCQELARQRQAFLDGATNNGADVGLRHRRLPQYLYEELPVDHPVLAAAASLDATCAECQRIVRDHLTRRA